MILNQDRPDEAEAIYAACEKHSERWSYIRDPVFGLPASVRRAYRRLFDYSIEARYLMGQFPARYVKQNVMDQQLRIITQGAGI